MYKKAMFGAGCFWGVEVAFRKTPGVVDTAVGYAGGSFSSPTYEDVCYNDTGHAEVVLVEFDEAKLKYHDLLDVFWRNHDPLDAGGDQHIPAGAVPKIDAEAETGRLSDAICGIIDDGHFASAGQQDLRGDLAEARKADHQHVRPSATEILRQFFARLGAAEAS